MTGCSAEFETFVQEAEVLLRLWAECSWSSELNAKSVKEML